MAPFAAPGSPRRRGRRSRAGVGRSGAQLLMGALRTARDALIQAYRYVPSMPPPTVQISRPLNDHGNAPAYSGVGTVPRHSSPAARASGKPPRAETFPRSSSGLKCGRDPRRSYARATTGGTARACKVFSTAELTEPARKLPLINRIVHRRPAPTSRRESARQRAWSR